MEAFGVAILVGAFLLVASILTSFVSFRVGAPLLLVFLVIGLIAGEDGPGGIVFNDAPLAFFVGSVALAIILFDSGFQTSLASTRSAIGPAVVLATLGVLVTTGIVALVAHYVLAFDWLFALLLGAIVSSTDAAAVFFLLRTGGIVLRERLRATLEIESGANDPIAIFLTISLAEAIRIDSQSFNWGFLQLFVEQMAGGAAFGVFGGVVLGLGIRRVPMDAALTPILVIASALLVFGAATVLGGSGFLAVYICGLVAGNANIPGGQSLKRFQGPLTWFCQIVMFLTLGLLATPSEFTNLLLPAGLVTIVLVFFARPIAVWLCMLPFRFGGREKIFIAWVGLRGGVSILLALVPMLDQLQNDRTFFNIAFLVVTFSLLVQGWTIRPVARRLGLIVPQRGGPVDRVEVELPGLTDHELVSYKLHENSPAAHGVRVPRWARPVLIRRAGSMLNLHNAGHLRSGDQVYLFTAPGHVPLLDKLYGRSPSAIEEESDLFGDFLIDPRAEASQVAATYGFRLAEELGSLTVAALFRNEYGEVETGDRLTLGEIALIARSVERGEVVEVGLLLEPARDGRVAFRAPAWLSSLGRRVGW